MKNLLLIIVVIILASFGACNKEKEKVDAEKPSVTILYPAELSEFIEGVNVKIKASASDNVGVKKVVFLIDGVEVSSDNSKPYEFEWETTGKVGSHTILIKAEDNAGNIGESSVISVKIEKAIENILAGYVYNILNEPVEGAEIYYELSLKNNPIQNDDLFEDNSLPELKDENHEAITGEWGKISKNGDEFASIEDALKTQSSNSAHRKTGNIHAEKEDANERKSLLNSGNDPVITDPNGYFEIGGLETNSYNLQIITDNYLEYNTAYTVHEGVNEKNYTLISDILPQTSGLSLSDGEYLVGINWSDLNFSTLKGYNVYSQHVFWYNADLEEDQHYYKPIYTDWTKINQSLLNNSQYSTETEEYNSKYGFYVLPVNIDNNETEYHSSNTSRRYTELIPFYKKLVTFSLTSGTGPVYIPDNTHEIAFHLRYYYTDIVYAHPSSWTVKISFDGNSWTTLSEHGLPDGAVHKNYYGYTKTISMNSYKGKTIYLKTTPSSFSSQTRGYTIENKAVEYSMDGTGFDTYELPTVETAEVSDITENSATCGGNVTDDGGLPITQRGVCLSTSENPTIEDFHTIDGSGLGSFTSSITGLDENTIYYVRAYATNSEGTAYGEEKTFSTPDGGGGGSTPCPGTPTVTYEGQTYNTVLIGNQCWLKENLNVGTRIDGTQEMTDNGIIEKYCYDDDPANCDIYGALYQWNEMMQYNNQVGSQGICPDGWHLPSDEEWKTLEMHLGMSQSEADDSGWRGTDEGKKMKSTSSWNNNGNGTNSSGFTALPGGFRGSNGSFYRLGGHGYWWSSTEYSGTYAWYRHLGYDHDQVRRNYYYYKTTGFSVRCLKD